MAGGLASIGIKKIVPAQIDFTKTVSGSFRVLGKVGIGQEDPTKTLTVEFRDDEKSLWGKGLVGATTGDGVLINNPSSTLLCYSNLDFRAGPSDGRIAYQYVGTNEGKFHFITEDGANGPLTAMTIDHNGNVGLGTAGKDVMRKLVVQGDNSAIRIANNRNDGDDFTGRLEISEDTNNNGDMTHGAFFHYEGTSTTNELWIGSRNNSTTDVKILRIDRESAADSIRVTSAGVGIGTDSPPKTLAVKFDDNDTAFTSGRGFASAGTAAGVLIENANGTTNSYANLDFRASNSDGRIAYQHTSTQQGAFHFICDNDGGTSIVSMLHNGNVGIGPTDPSAHLHVRDPSQVTFIIQESNANSSGGSYYFFQKSRGTAASKAAVQENDELGLIYFQGYNANGTAYDTAATIRCAVDGEPGTTSDDSDMPGRLEFRTSPDGSSSDAVKMVIKSTGKVGIGTSTPTSMLEISADSVGGPGPHHIHLHEESAEYARLSFTNDADNNGNLGNYSHEWTLAGKSATQTDSDDANASAQFNIWYGDADGDGTGADILTVRGDKKVGINQSSPTSELHVGGTVTATSFAGTITTAAQPNITSLGTITNLTVGGFVSATTLQGSIQTAAQTNITSVGTLTGLTVGTTGTKQIRIHGDNTGDARLRIDNGQGDHYIFDDQSDGNKLKIQSAHELVLKTDGSNVSMKIDDNGLITTPGQPCFGVYRSNTGGADEDPDIPANGSFNTIVWNTEIFDIGADFDTGTGIFTAPVDGQYLFTGVLEFNAVDASEVNYILATLVVSDLDHRFGVYDPDTLTQTGADSDVTLPFAFQLHMDKNDTAKIQVKTVGASITMDGGTPQGGSSFQGYLLG